MSILIKKVQHKGKNADIFIEDNIISRIADKISARADTVIDGSDMAVLPGLINAHTHAAMSLFRGYADDQPLEKWLTGHIWPLEAKLTGDDYYWGSKLAILEMIKTGTTCFLDMYWQAEKTAQAAQEMGIRAILSPGIIDIAGPAQAKDLLEKVKMLCREQNKYGRRLRFALGPHTIYTASTGLLKEVKKFADRNNLLIHIHLSETVREVSECLEKYGKRPVEYLDSLGFLGPNVIAAHMIWLNDNEIEICAKRNITVVYNPVSNLKLASGINFRYQDLKKAGVNVILGTDSAASNNNLDMFEEMKFAALIQKAVNNNPTALPAEEVLAMATVNAAKALKIEAGEIAEGKLADLILVDLKRAEMALCHNLDSDLVYSANGSCVDTTIVDGQVLMQHRKVKGEEEIIKRSIAIAKDLITR